MEGEPAEPVGEVAGQARHATATGSGNEGFFLDAPALAGPFRDQLVGAGPGAEAWIGRRVVATASGAQGTPESSHVRWSSETSRSRA